MVGISSILPPARPGSGGRPVQSVIGPSRGNSKQRQPEPGVRATERDANAWRDRDRDHDRIGGESFIDADFVEVLREAASTTAAIDPADETLRQALTAYRRAGELRSILGSVVDIPI